MDPAARRRLHDDLARLSDGDRAAAAPAFQALWPACLQLARRALHNEADASDAAQQALTKLFAGLARFDPDRSALGWALALVTWECRTIRQQRRRRRVDDGTDLDAVVGADHVDEAVFARIDHARDVADIASAFVVLDAADQQTLADFLDGAPAGTPRDRKRRQRAIDRLRALVLGPKAAPVVTGDDHG